MLTLQFFSSRRNPSYVRKIFHTLLLKSHLEKDSATSTHKSNKCYSRKIKKNILLLYLSRFVSGSKFFPSVCYLFSQVSQAGIVSRKGHKFSAYGLELAQPFLNTIFLFSRTGKKVTHTWKNFSHGKSRQL